jgi:hypothetical protein
VAQRLLNATIGAMADQETIVLLTRNGRMAGITATLIRYTGDGFQPLADRLD